jgi:hypothetical protein
VYDRLSASLCLDSRVPKDYSTAKSGVLRRYTSHLGRVSLRSAIPRLSYLVIVVPEDYSTA